jgi:hypothetical protein
MPTILEANFGLPPHIPTPVGAPEFTYPQPQGALHSPSLQNALGISRAASLPDDGRTTYVRQNPLPVAPSPLAPRARDRPLLVNPEVGTPRSRRRTAEHNHVSSPSRRQQDNTAYVRGLAENPYGSSPTHPQQHNTVYIRGPAENPHFSSPSHCQQEESNYIHATAEHPHVSSPGHREEDSTIYVHGTAETLAGQGGVTLTPQWHEATSPKRGEREMVTPRAPGGGWAGETLSPMLRSHAVELTPGGEGGEVWTSSVHGSPGHTGGRPVEV